MKAVDPPQKRPGWTEVLFRQCVGPLKRLKLPQEIRGRVFILLIPLLCGLAAAPASAQPQMENDTPEETYNDLWQRGAYKEALSILEARIYQRKDSYIPHQWSLDYGELLFANGRVGDAIGTYEELESRRWELPQSVRLAEMYRYRGRMDDYEEMLTQLQRRAEWAKRYANEEDWVALARIDELSGVNPNQILGTHLELLIDQRSRFAPGLVMAGDLAYRHKGYDVAADYYNRALEIEPENQAALAGLAECYWQSGDPRLEDTLTKIRELNPNHPRLLALQVEEFLDLGKAAKALEVIDERLEVNENDLHFLSLKAAAHFLRDEPAQRRDTADRALNFNPHWSEVHRLPGRIASRHYRFEEAVEFQRDALDVDPTDYEAMSLLAFNLLRLGEDEEGVLYLEAAYEADKFNVHTVNLLEVMDSIASFETIDHGAFRIQLPEQEAKIMSEDMIALLEEALVTYENKYDVRVARPVVIQMFDDHDEFMVRSVGLPGNRGHLGICFGRLLTMDSPRARPPGSTNWRSVLWHEFVHVITLQKTENRMPRWLSEGISVYEETARSKAWGQKLEPEFKRFVKKEDGWPAMADLQRYFTQPESGTHLIYGYFLAGEFIAYYVDAYGIEALVDALEAIRQTEDAGEALVAAADTNLEALNEGFAAHLDKRCAPLDNLPDVPDMDEADGGQLVHAWTSLSSPFTDTLKEAAEAAAEGRFDVAEQKFLEADELFSEFQGPHAPLNQLAALYKQQGKEEKYRETLERIAKREATALPALEKLTNFAQEAEQWNAVVEYSSEAFAVNPFDLAMRRAWLEGLKATGKTAQAAEALDMLAYLDAQHRTDYRMERARLLAQAGEAGAARKETLELLEAMPHFWEAQELLLELNDGGANGESD